MGLVDQTVQGVDVISATIVATVTDELASGINYNRIIDLI